MALEHVSSAFFVSVVSIGITGGIGCGKSALATILSGRRLPLIDTDDIARELLEPGGRALDEVTAAFGAGVLTASGVIDRPALAAIVFSNATALARLEQILHPRIQTHWASWLEQCRSEGKRAAFVVIPLLYEKAYEEAFDRIVAVACSRRTQNVRLRTRGWTDEAIQSRITAQLPLEEKMRRADFVLWNEGSLDGLDSQCRQILGSLELL